MSSGTLETITHHHAENAVCDGVCFQGSTLLSAGYTLRKSIKPMDLYSAREGGFGTDPFISEGQKSVPGRDIRGTKVRDKSILKTLSRWYDTTYRGTRNGGQIPGKSMVSKGLQQRDKRTKVLIYNILMSLSVHGGGERALKSGLSSSSRGLRQGTQILGRIIEFSRGTFVPHEKAVERDTNPSGLV